MSVLTYRRTESKAQYVTDAIEIYTRTVNFLSRLSARYSRLMSQKISDLAFDLVTHCEEANSLYPSDDERKRLRKEKLLEARAELNALDVHLTLAYQTLLLNPAGAFTTASGKAKDEGEAIKRIDNMAQALGDLLNKEKAALTSLLKG